MRLSSLLATTLPQFPNSASKNSFHPLCPSLRPSSWRSLCLTSWGISLSPCSISLNCGLETLHFRARLFFGICWIAIAPRMAASSCLSLLMGDSLQKEILIRVSMTDLWEVKKTVKSGVFVLKEVIWEKANSWIQQKEGRGRDYPLGCFVLNSWCVIKIEDLQLQMFTRNVP